MYTSVILVIRYKHLFSTWKSFKSFFVVVIARSKSGSLMSAVVFYERGEAEPYLGLHLFYLHTKCKYLRNTDSFQFTTDR